MKLKKITTFLLAIAMIGAFATSNAQEVDRNDKDGDGIKDRKDLCPATPTGVKVDANGCPLDTDRDGVVDYLDKCPDTPGSAEMNGCQDKDKDGVSDNDDACVDVPGLARFKGCPDSDGDGVEDSKDKCPNEKGSDRFNGCPDNDADGIEDSKDKCKDTPKGVKVDMNGCSSDSDNDGVSDSEDGCPTVAGLAVNKGCPEKKVDVKKRLQFAARGINFETGKATLTTSSYPMLDEVVSILNEYVDYNLKMGGHTDAVGNANSNLSLSQARVDAVKAYLISKGIADTRVVATGFGKVRPIASNANAVGRAKNRRVELELFLK